MPFPNPDLRRDIWQGLHDQAKARLAASRKAEGIPSDLKARIISNNEKSVEMTRGFLEYYTK